MGRELGTIRGMASALLVFVTSRSPETTEERSLAIEARDIVSQLSSIRFTDIAPRDLEAEEHARQHLEDDESGLGVKGELVENMKMDVALLKSRLDNLALKLGLATTSSGYRSSFNSLPILILIGLAPRD